MDIYKYLKAITEGKTDQEATRIALDSKIHNGSEVVRCSKCGMTIPVPAGTCTTCPNCFTQFGGCG